MYGRLAALLVPRTRVVFTEHGRLSDAPPSAKRRRATRLLTLGVHELYAVSHDLRRHLLEEGFPERMGVIWNGIEPDAERDASARASARLLLQAAAGDVVIGSVGRLDPVKDFGTLVAAFAAASARDARLLLVLIGDGPERAALEAAIGASGAGDRVRLMGHREDVRQLLPGFDIFANSSITEGVSLTVLEAMAAALPVVATRVGGTPEVVIDGETGMLVEARNAPTLGAVLAQVSSDPPRMLVYGRSGRQRLLDHFTLDRMVEDYAATYQRAFGA